MLILVSLAQCPRNMTTQTRSYDHREEERQRTDNMPTHTRGYDHREEERQRTDNMQGCVHHYFVHSWRLPALEETKSTHISAQRNWRNSPKETKFFSSGVTVYNDQVVCIHSKYMGQFTCFPTAKGVALRLGGFHQVLS